MGASPFITKAHGTTAKDAFSHAVDAALREYGHGGYTGTIAEKESFTIIELPEGCRPYTQAARLIDQDDERIEDKWGPAGVFVLGHGRFLFFGWASS